MTAITNCPGHGGLIAPASATARQLFCAGHAWWHLEEPEIVTPESWVDVLRGTHVRVIAYMPWLRGPSRSPHLVHAKAVFAACRCARVPHLVLVSSTAANRNGADATASRWRALEWSAFSSVGYRHVTLLRAACEHNLPAAIGCAMQHRTSGILSLELCGQCSRVPAGQVALEPEVPVRRMVYRLCSFLTSRARDPADAAGLAGTSDLA